MRARPLRRRPRPRASSSERAPRRRRSLSSAAGRVERAPAEQRRGRGPGLGLAGPALGARLRAERDELGEVVHRLDAAGRRDPDEPVGVEVVAEQERRVGVGRREEPRPAVVEQVALVDRLHPERERRLAELREDRRTVSRSPAGRSDSRPERALGRRLGGEGLPDVGLSCRRSRQRPRSSCRSRRRRARARRTCTRTGTVPRRCRGRAGAGRAPHTAPCRSATASS